MATNKINIIFVSLKKLKKKKIIGPINTRLINNNYPVSLKLNRARDIDKILLKSVCAMVLEIYRTYREDKKIGYIHHHSFGYDFRIFVFLYVYNTFVVGRSVRILQPCTSARTHDGLY